jgi:curved DNA-binding protein CbpA
MKNDINLDNNANNPYEILKLPNFSSTEEIKTQYKIMIKYNHPDKGGTSENFNKIKEAFDFLNNSDLKENFDRNLKCNIIIIIILYIDNLEMLEKAEEVEFEIDENKAVFDCIQCFSKNSSNMPEPLKYSFNKDVDNVENIYIVSCECCSKLYKINFNI